MHLRCSGVPRCALLQSSGPRDRQQRGGENISPVSMRDVPRTVMRDPDIMGLVTEKELTMVLPRP
ncbi:MAG: hypothetical protein MZV63_53175 [Marinilabiliales bacterium]|nr:hypothetical protein [Marinilabiliales bacterium]